VKYHYTDTSVSENASLIIATNDSVHSADTIPMRVSAVRTAVRSTAAPLSFSVNAYPDPFDAATTIGYTLAQSAPVTVKIFNSLGVEITTLVNEMQTAGQHSVTLNGSDLSNGTYFYQFAAGSFIRTGKLTVIH